MITLAQISPSLSLTPTDLLLILIGATLLVSVAIAWRLAYRTRSQGPARSTLSLLLLQNRSELRDALKQREINRPSLAVIADVFPVTVMLLFLLIGMACAWVGPLLVPWLSQLSSRPIAATNGWDLVAEQTIRPAEGPALTDETPLRDYSQLLLFTRTISPTESAALVTIYGERTDGATEEKRLPIDGTWSIWELPNAYTRVRMGVTPQGNTPAREVRILLYARK